MIESSQRAAVNAAPTLGVAYTVALPQLQQATRVTTR